MTLTRLIDVGLVLDHGPAFDELRVESDHQLDIKVAQIDKQNAIRIAPSENWFLPLTFSKLPRYFHNLLSLVNFPRLRPLCVGNILGFVAKSRRSFFQGTGFTS